MVSFFRAKGRHLQRLPLGDDRDRTICNAGWNRMRKQAQRLLREGARRQVIIVRLDATQQITHAPANRPSLKARLLQLIDAGANMGRESQNHCSLPPL